MATATADTTPETATATATILSVVIPPLLTLLSSTSVNPDSHEGDCKETSVNSYIEDLTMPKTKLKVYWNIPSLNSPYFNVQNGKNTILLSQYQPSR